MSWKIGEVIEETFEVFIGNWVALVVGNVVATAISFSPLILWAAIVVPPMIARGQIDDHGNLDLLASGALGSMLAAAASTVVLAIMFAPAMSRIALAAVRGEKPRIGDVFNFRRVGSFMVAGLLAGLAIGVGFLLLIVPGVIAALGLAYVSFFVIDERRPHDGIEALGASWTAARGSKAMLLGLVLIGALVSWAIKAIAGLSIFLMPISVALALVQTPISVVALAAIYVKINPLPAETKQLAA